MSTGNRIIYIVTDGDYSDYRIQAVFSSKKKAERYSDEYCKSRETSSRPNIEEWTLDGSDEDVSKVAFRCVIELSTGKIVSEWDFKELAPKRKRAAGVLEHANRENSRCVESYVSKDHARKLAVEARQKHLRSISATPKGAR